MLGLALAGAASLAASLCLTGLAYGAPLGPSLLTCIWIRITGLGGVLALVVGFMPIELTADDDGISWKQWFIARSYRWAEIETIGIGKFKAFDGWDQPGARVLIGPAPSSPNYLGLNLVLGDRNAATVSYKRGFTGFDVTFTPVFKPSLGQIVAELQVRLESARTNAAVSSHPSSTPPIRLHSRKSS